MYAKKEVKIALSIFVQSKNLHHNSIMLMLNLINSQGQQRETVIKGMNTKMKAKTVKEEVEKRNRRKEHQKEKIDPDQ